MRGCRGQSDPADALQRGRANLEQIGEYLRERIAKGELRPVPGARCPGRSRMTPQGSLAPMAESEKGRGPEPG